MTIDDAIRLHRAGRLPEAERLYRSILDAEPQHPDALHLLGVLLTQTGEHDDGVGYIQAALKIHRDSVPFQSSLAQAYYRSGKVAEAVEVLERVVVQQPDSFQAYSDLGAVLQESGELERAVEAYRRAIGLNSGLAIVHFNLGTALKQQGFTADAIACVEKAVAMDPSQANFRATLAGYYLEADEPRAALESCRACLSVAPQNLMALTFMSIALDRLGDHDRASQIVDFDRLIQQRRIVVPAGFTDILQFNKALAHHVRTHPTLRADPINNATRFGKHTENLLADPGGPIPAFAELIDEAVTDYIRSLPREPGHPYLTHRPTGFAYQMWSVVMDSQGHQLPHIHPDGWVSGVYYVELPRSMHAATQEHEGWIEFGRPLRELTGPLEPEVKMIRPEEGMLVLFPSYFYHQTIPFESTEQRICIAFDAVPRFRGPAGDIPMTEVH
jgi:uncharacterized protein (TIGR02466 family)